MALLRRNRSPRAWEQASVRIDDAMTSELERWQRQISSARDGAWEGISEETEGAESPSGRARAADIAEEMAGLVARLEEEIAGAVGDHPAGTAVARSMTLNLLAGQLTNREADLIAAVSVPVEV